MKLKPGLSNRMRKISKEIRNHIITEHLRELARKGGESTSEKKVASSRASMAAINARRAQRKAGTEPALTQP